MPKGKKKDDLELFNIAPSTEDMESMKDFVVPDSEKEAVEKSTTVSSEYFDILEEGDEDGDNYARNDMKDVIMSLWEKSKTIPKSEWVKIRLLKTVCDPTVSAKQHEKLMEAAQKIKDTPRLAINLDNWKTIQEEVWKKGTVLRLPKPIADFYLSLNYVLGYEGFGNPGDNRFPGREKVGLPVIQRTAELVK